VLLCPDCATTNVEVTASRRPAGDLRWRGRCVDCGRDWEFDDD
jgi:transposase-like protein